MTFPDYFTVKFDDNGKKIKVQFKKVPSEGNSVKNPNLYVIKNGSIKSMTDHLGNPKYNYEEVKIFCKLKANKI